MVISMMGFYSVDPAGLAYEWVSHVSQGYDPGQGPSVRQPRTRPRL